MMLLQDPTFVLKPTVRKPIIEASTILFPKPRLFPVGVLILDSSYLSSLPPHVDASVATLSVLEYCLQVRLLPLETSLMALGGRDFGTAGTDSLGFKYH